MISDERLMEFNQTQVAILDNATLEVTRIVTVAEVTEGTDFYVSTNGKQFLLIDYQDESDQTEIGETEKEALESLNGYTEYFNDYYNPTGWQSDFCYSLKTKEGL